MMKVRIAAKRAWSSAFGCGFKRFNSKKPKTNR
jgi:hypothetical protein